MISYPCEHQDVRFEVYLIAGTLPFEVSYRNNIIPFGI